MDIITDTIESLDFPALRVPSIGINTIIEIIILTYVTYKIIQWVKRTTAWTLFRGIIVIVLISFLSYLLKLHTLTWLISNTFNVGVIAAIVIFQPELRSALERLGKNTFIRFIAPAVAGENELSGNAAAQIIEAAFAMSKTNTGAFIVIERGVSLAEYEKTGTKIDSLVSAQLLANIFVDKTPLHDGAVVVKKGRIAYASCIMPLTKREIGAEYGTRHRAAVGTSEVSDAYVVVVSEETGAVSLAHEGELYKSLSRAELEKILIEDLKPAKRKGFKARRGKRP